MIARSIKSQVQAQTCERPELRRPVQTLPHHYVGTAPNFAALVAGRMGKKRRAAAAAHA
jgi:hypothetical protein